MFVKTFLKIFPPPKFLDIHYAGLDISDDAIRIIEYSNSMRGLKLHKYGVKNLEQGIIESGHIKKEKDLITALSTLAKELKISVVKASLPEERMYLFKTEVFGTDEDKIRQSIEFKLEENVPISASESLFFFDLIPKHKINDKTFASVSVAPKELVDSYLRVIQYSGLHVISFEIQPKAIARAVIPKDSNEIQMIVHTMRDKTGIYIVCGGVVCFTSTVDIKKGDDTSMIKHELSRVYAYWSQYGEGRIINKIILSGQDALRLTNDTGLSPDPKITVEIAHIWQNAFSNDHYIPPIIFENSLEYVVAAGLALP